MRLEFLKNDLVGVVEYTKVLISVKDNSKGRY